MRRSVVVLSAVLAASTLLPIASATARSPADTSADLGMTLTGSQTALPGGRVTYQATIHNAGPDAAEDLRFGASWTLGSLARIDSLSGASGSLCFSTNGSLACNDLGGLAAGATKTISITGTVAAHLSPGQMDFKTTVSAKTADPGPAGNAGQVQTTIGPAADLAATLTGPATARRGDWITYEVKVANRGPVTAASAKFVLRLPGGVTYKGSPLACGVQLSDVTCDLGDLPKNGTNTISVSGKVDADVPIGRVLQAVARAQSNLHDSVPADNTVSVNITVVQPPPPPTANVAITGKVGALRKGRAGTYTLTVTNKGPAAAKGIVVAGTLPRGLTFKAVRGCKRARNGIKCTIPNLKPGAKVTIVLTVAVARTASGARTYIVTAKPTTKDLAPGNNTVRIKRTITR